jgi:hypothetical protein
MPFFNTKPPQAEYLPEDFKPLDYSRKDSWHACYAQDGGRNLTAWVPTVRTPPHALHATPQPGEVVACSFSTRFRLLYPLHSLTAHCHRRLVHASLSCVTNTCFNTPSPTPATIRFTGDVAPQVRLTCNNGGRGTDQATWGEEPAGVRDTQSSALADLFYVHPTTALQGVYSIPFPASLATTPCISPAVAHLPASALRGNSEDDQRVSGETQLCSACGAGAVYETIAQIPDPRLYQMKDRVVRAALRRHGKRRAG